MLGSFKWWSLSYIIIWHPKLTESPSWVIFFSKMSTIQTTIIICSLLLVTTNKWDARLWQQTVLLICFYNISNSSLDNELLTIFTLPVVSVLPGSPLRSVKNNNLGTNIGTTQIDILGFSDDLNLIGDSMEIVEQNINTLVEGAK